MNAAEELPKSHIRTFPKVPQSAGKIPKASLRFFFKGTFEARFVLKGNFFAETYTLQGMDAYPTEREKENHLQICHF